MFGIGDYVLNQKTGNIGRVIGYGHQIINGVYMSTLKVLVAEAVNSQKRGFVEEELYSTWTQWQGVSAPTFR